MKILKLTRTNTLALMMTTESAWKKCSSKVRARENKKERKNNKLTRLKLVQNSFGDFRSIFAAIPTSACWSFYDFSVNDASLEVMLVLVEHTKSVGMRAVYEHERLIGFPRIKSIEQWTAKSATRLERLLELPWTHLVKYFDTFS